ncbi:hypothetical protein [Oceanibaculum indicum]|uniref:Uncharacterized protein n=1 Tax=Oceanibaculum indicum TaxID=526216 RepID=A0A420W9Z3_9PROT|nr:hypothetical protein [Oceanibaculum indicum]RKQ64136.1 hypothetical protein BCL74_3677 [Oceanibaculum indicum]
MPKKTRPMYGFQSRPMLYNEPETHFDEATVYRLADLFEIEDRDDFAKFLNGTATVYKNHKVTHDDRPRAKHIRAALTEIETLAKQLGGKLAKLDELTEWRLWEPESQVHHLAYYSDEAESPYGQWFHRNELEGGGRSAFYVGRLEILTAMDVLVNYSKAAKAKLPRETGGAPTSEALRMWVSSSARYWTETLGRPYTLDIHNGEGTTPAYWFCWECLSAFTNAHTKRQVATAMRKVGEDNRRRAKLPTVTVHLQKPTPKKG